MELKQGLLSVFKLVSGGMKTACRCFLSAFILLILLLIVFFLCRLADNQAAALLGPQLAGWAHTLLGLAQAALGLMSVLALIKLAAARAEKYGLTLSESLAAVWLPAGYFVLGFLLLSIPVFVLLLAACQIHAPQITVMVCIWLGLAALPFVLFPQVLVLRDEKPLPALRYSWDLGTDHYVRLVGVLLLLAVLVAFVALAASCAVKGLFPQLFSQQRLTTWLAALPQNHFLILVTVAALGILFIFLTILSTLTVLFLNLDYTHRLVQNRESDAAQAVTLAAATSDEVTPEVGVTQTSVRTHTDEDTARHLDQVYSAQEHLSRANAKEEDRMPTILFDDDLARQITQSEQALQPAEAAPAEEDPGADSVKISDKPL